MVPDPPTELNPPATRKGLAFDLAWTFLIQGFGAISVLFTAVIIGQRVGLEAQGIYNLVKNEMEFIGAIAIFGLPQAVLFFLDSGRISLRYVAGLGIAASLAAILFGAIYAISFSSFDPATLFLFLFACVALVNHTLIRICLLSIASPKIFNVFTAAPQVLMLVLAIWAVSTGVISAYLIAALFLIAFLSVDLVGLIWLFSQRNRVTSDNPAALRDVVTYSSASGLSASLNVTTILIAVKYLEATRGLADVGLYAFGIMLVTAFLTPLNYAVPLLFKRWMQVGNLITLGFMALATGFCALALVASVAYIHELFFPDFFPTRYLPFLDLKWPFVVMVAIEVAMRMLSPLFGAKGRPWVPAMAETVRIVLIIVLFSLASAPSISFVAWSVVAAGSCALAFYYAALLTLQIRQNRATQKI